MRTPALGIQLMYEFLSSSGMSFYPEHLQYILLTYVHELGLGLGIGLGLGVGLVLVLFTFTTI